MATGQMQPLPEPDAMEWDAEFIVVEAHQPVGTFRKVFAASSVSWFIVRRSEAKGRTSLFYAFNRSEVRDALRDPAAGSLADALRLRDEDASRLVRDKEPLPKNIPAAEALSPSRNRVVVLDGELDPCLVGEVRPAEPVSSFNFSLGSLQQEPAPPPLPLPKDGRAVVRIFYGTDRKRDAESLDVVYLGERSEGAALELGTCDIAVPHDHKRGKLEIKTWLNFLFRSNDCFFDLLATTPSESEESFYEQLKAQVSASSSNDIFVFIHGFYISFEDAAFRTAQLAYDLGFKGAPILYSWPAGGAILDYAGDDASVNWSMPHLKGFLRDLKRRGGVGKISLIAHSMGNLAMARCLKEIALEGSASDLGLQQIIMAAPDIDRGEFLQIAAEINGTASRITLYASSEDKALKLSQKLHSGYPRAGEAGENMVVVQGVDTVDASSVDTSFYKHSYFGEKTVVSDIFYLITHGLAPADRDGLFAKRHANGEYWEFMP